MTITATVPKNAYTATGGTAFPYTFKISAAADMNVYVNEVLTSTGFTIDGVGSVTGGNVTFTVAPANGTKILLTRSTIRNQGTDWTANDPDPAESKENAFDKAMGIDQEQDETLGRTLRIPIVESLDMLIPSLAARKSKALGFDTNGLPTIINLPTAAGGDISLATAIATGSITARSMATRFSEIINVKDYGAVGDGTADDTSAIAAAFTAAGGPTPAVGQGKTVFFPVGNYKITSTLTLPRAARIIGGTRRGLANPPNAIGVGISAAFAGPALQASPGALTSYDTYVSGMHIRGDKATYPTGNGINLANVADITLENVIVSNFGTNNINVASTSNHIYIRDVYSAQAGNANFFVAGGNCSLQKAVSDGGVYSLDISAGGVNVSVYDCHFEGATTAAIRVADIDVRLVSNYISQNAANADGILVNAARCAVIGNVIAGSGTRRGIDISASVIEYRITGNHSIGYTTACRVNGQGFGALGNNIFEGTATGLEVVDTTFGRLVVTGNVIAGPTNSLLHSAGSKAMYIGNSFDNGSGAYKAPTISAGSPVIVTEAADGVLAITGNLTISGTVSGLNPTFESSDQTVTLSTKLTIAHGLGAKPKLVQLVLKNATAELNYSIGDEVTQYAAAGGVGATVVADATNIVILQLASITIPDKNTFTNTAITAANWKWVVRAWK